MSEIILFSGRQKVAPKTQKVAPKACTLRKGGASLFKPTIYNELPNYVMSVSVKEGCTLLGIAHQNINKALKGGKFPGAFQVKGNGGLQWRIPVADLPEDAQKRFLEESGIPVGPSSQDVEKWKTAAASRDILTKQQYQYMIKRKAVLERYREAVSGAGYGRIVEVKTGFCEAYNCGMIPELAFARDLVRSVSPQTLDSWSKLVDDEGGNHEALVPEYGHNRGKRAVSSTEAEILKRYALMPNQFCYAEIIKLMKKELRQQGSPARASDATYTRWLKDFREKAFPVWVLTREGKKALNDKKMPYVERDIERVSVGDMIVADGHTLNFDMRDPLRNSVRRMTLVMLFDYRSSMPVGWEIASSENVRAISMAMYRAVNMLGFVPRTFNMDNGRAFRSKYFTKVNENSFAEVGGLFERMRPYGFTGTIFSEAYNGQAKTVERFFGRLNEFEKTVYSYRGNSIDNKVARTKRGEFLHRELYEKLFKGGAPEVTQIYPLLQEWIDEYAATPSGRSTSLKGRRPIDVYLEGIERVKSMPGHEARMISQGELQMLMMETREVSLYRNGIKLFGRHYFSEALFQFETGRKDFVVRYDLHDLSKVLVYDASGKFLCEAVADVFANVHPLAAHLGTEEDVRRLGEVIDRKKTLSAATVRLSKEFWNANARQEQRALPSAALPKPAVKAVVNGSDITNEERMRFREALDAADAELERRRAAEDEEKARFRSLMYD